MKISEKLIKLIDENKLKSSQVLHDLIIKELNVKKNTARVYLSLARKALNISKLKRSRSMLIHNVRVEDVRNIENHNTTPPKNYKERVEKELLIWNVERNSLTVTYKYIEHLLCSYNLHRKLNESLYGRKINFPEEISQAVVAYYLGYELVAKGGGDLLDQTGNKIDLKAVSSTTGAPSSISDRDVCDYYQLIIFNDCGQFYIYDKISREIVNNIQVNVTETVKDQANYKRRPRFDFREFITKNNTSVIYKGNMLNVNQNC